MGLVHRGQEIGCWFMQAAENLLIRYCCETDHLSGDLAEVGVWRGDSSAVILRHTSHGLLYMYDTFCGMPVSMCSQYDYHKPGSFGDTSLSVAMKAISAWSDRVLVRVGIFPETADDGLFRFVHIDCDQYLSTKAALEWFAPRIVQGGIILLDDHLCSTTPGAKKAADEFISANSLYWIENVGTRGVLRHSHEEALK